MEATPFLDYLHEHHTTARLAEVFREIVDTRRAAAQRRARGLQPVPIPIPVETARRVRAAS